MSTWSSDGGATISGNGLIATITNSTTAYAMGTIGRSSGKRYFEGVWTCSGGLYNSGFLGISASGTSVYRAVYSENGNKWSNGTISAYTTVIASGSVIGCAVDFDSGTITFSKNGVSLGVAFTDIATMGTVCPLFFTKSSSTTGSMELRTQASQFYYAPPDGYVAWSSTTWNPSKMGGKVVLSNSNFTATTNYYSDNTVLSNNGKNSGKRYFEVGIVCSTTVRGVVGVGNSTVDVSADNFYNNTSNTNSRAVAMYDGAKYPGMIAYGSGFVSGDTVMCKVDFDSRTIEFGKNGTWFGTAFSDLSGFGTAYILLSSASSGAYITEGTLRTASGEFAYSVPAGYVAWDTVTTIIHPSPICIF